MPCFLNNSTISTIEVFLGDAAGAGVAGLNLASFAAGEFQVGKSNAGAFVDAAGVLSGRAGGSYTYKPTAGEADTLGDIVLKFVKATLNNGKPIIVQDEVRPSEWRGVLVAGVLTATQFRTDRTEVENDHWKDNLIEFLSGPNAGCIKPVGAYVGATKDVSLVAGFALPNLPTAGDKFRFISR